MVTTNTSPELQRILLIGDDPNILRTLRRNLVGRGYEVSIALDDYESYTMVSQLEPSLCILILDFTTINLDGLEVCSQLRTRTTTPIIALSTVGSPEVEVNALDNGADDYLLMPFGMEEFLARVRSVLRRTSQSQSKSPHPKSIIVVQDLLIDVENRQVVVRDEQVHFTPTEYNLLLYLAQRGGKVVTHRELLRSIWGTEYGDEREYLRVFISQIRRKIEEDPLRPDYILTVPGVGYRFRD